MEKQKQNIEQNNTLNNNPISDLVNFTKSWVFWALLWHSPNLESASLQADLIDRQKAVLDRNSWINSYENIFYSLSPKKMKESWFKYLLDKSIRPQYILNLLAIDNRLDHLTIELLAKNFISPREYRVFADYFNTMFFWRRNDFLRELLIANDFRKIFDYFENNKLSFINVWNKSVKLYWKINLYKALLDYSELSGISDYDLLIKAYENVLNTNLDTKDDIQDVFLITYNQWVNQKQARTLTNNEWINIKNFDSNWAFIWLKDIINKQYSNSEWFSHILPSNAKEFIWNLPKFLWDKRKTLLYIWLHWDMNWDSWPLEKIDYDYINRLAKRYKNLRVVIDSCNSKYKFRDKYGNFDLEKNITISSWLQVSTNWYNKMIKESYKYDKNWWLKWDYNSDGKVDHKEASMYTFLNYKDSFVIWRI